MTPLWLWDITDADRRVLCWSQPWYAPYPLTISVWLTAEEVELLGSHTSTWK